MSESHLSSSPIQCALATLVSAFLPFHLGKVALYQTLAHRLSETAGRSPPWTWRYVQSVDAGTLAPSSAFAQAVFNLTAVVEKNPPPLLALERVEVYVRPGTVQPGTFLIASSQRCRNPACPVSFISVSPKQILCPYCQTIFERKIT